MHDHSKCCDHDLKYCPVCDVAYCTKCGREWYGYKVTYSSTNAPEWVFPETTSGSSGVTISSVFGPIVEPHKHG